jgi:hypothetical protein
MLEPRPVPAEIVRQLARLDHDGRLWKYWEKRTGSGKTYQSLFLKWGQLTVADCEQLAEQYCRLAHKAIDRFMMRGGSRHTAKTAAEYIRRSRLMRFRYQELTGQPFSEQDQTFGILTAEEAAGIAAKFNSDAG